VTESWEEEEHGNEASLAVVEGMITTYLRAKASTTSDYTRWIHRRFLPLDLMACPPGSPCLTLLTKTQLAPTTFIKYKIRKMQCNCVPACCENRHAFCVALYNGGKCVTADFIAFSPPVSRKLRNAASDGSYEEGV